MNEATRDNSGQNADDRRGADRDAGQAPNGANGQAPNGQAPGGHGTAHDERPTNFFDWIRNSGLRRADDRWLAGVCAGIAQRTGLDPMIIRGIAIVVALLGGPVFLAYAAGWALMPDARGNIHVERLFRGVFDPAIIVIAAFVALTFLPFMRGIWWQGPPVWWNMPDWLEATMRTGWVLALVAGVIWLIVYIARRAPQSRNGGAPHGGGRSHSEFWTSPQATPPRPPQGAATGVTWTAGTTGAAFSQDAGARHPAPDTAGNTVPEDAPGRPGAQADPDQTAGAGQVPFGSGGSGRPEAGGDEYGQSRHGFDPYGGTRPGDWGEWAGTWGERTGAWGERIGAQGERMSADIDRAAREHAERRKLRQPGAAFVAIALGLAVVAGAVAASLATRSGDWNDHTTLVGLGAALGVIAIATIVAGIRGRESGWLGFFAVIAVIGMLFTGVFPRSTQVMPFGKANWSTSEIAPSDERGYAMFAGDATLDLADLDEARAAETGGVVDVWLAFGNLELIVPDEAKTLVEVNAFIGGMDRPGEGDENHRGGMFYGDDAEYGDRGASEVTTVRVWTFIGNVDITETRE
ncbi:hypothetical protein GCM10027416_31550 [Okibacterium endophyticum]